VRALRQFVQTLDPRFGAAAARAQQIPAHRQDAAMLRGEKQLHRVGRRRAPKPGQRQRPDAAQRHARRLLEVRGEFCRQPVARRVAREVGDQRIEPALARRRRRLVFAGCENPIRHVYCGGQLLNRSNALVELAVQLTGKLCQKSQRSGAFDLGRENQPAAAALGIELGVELEVPKRAVLELPLLGEPAVFLPLAEPLVPVQAQGTGLGGRGPPGAAIGVEPIRHLIGRRSGHFVEPRGIGEKRPDRLGRLREMRLLAVPIDRCHVSVAAGATSLSQIRQMSSKVSPPSDVANLPCSLEPFAQTFQTNINSL
jgi:hypothetical protein